LTENLYKSLRVDPDSGSTLWISGFAAAALSTEGGGETTFGVEFSGSVERFGGADEVREEDEDEDDSDDEEEAEDGPIMRLIAAINRAHGDVGLAEAAGSCGSSANGWNIFT
jgi:hypothetical protein